MLDRGRAGPARLDPAQPVERRECLGWIGGERRDHRSRRAVRDGDRRERIAHERDRARPTWSAALPGVWPGTRTTRGAPGTSSVAPSPNVATAPRFFVRSAPCGCRAAGTAAAGAAGSGRRPWPGWEPRPARAPHRARGPDTGIPRSVRARSAKPMWSEWPWVSTRARTSSRLRPIAPQLREQVVPLAGQPGVDDRDRRAVDEQVAVDQPRSESMDPVGDPHPPLPSPR